MGKRGIWIFLGIFAIILFSIWFFVFKKSMTEKLIKNVPANTRFVLILNRVEGLKAFLNSPKSVVNYDSLLKSKDSVLYHFIKDDIIDWQEGGFIFEQNSNFVLVLKQNSNKKYNEFTKKLKVYDDENQIFKMSNTGFYITQSKDNIFVSSSKSLEKILLNFYDFTKPKISKSFIDSVEDIKNKALVYGWLSINEKPGQNKNYFVNLTKEEQCIDLKCFTQYSKSDLEFLDNTKSVLNYYDMYFFGNDKNAMMSNVLGFVKLRDYPLMNIGIGKEQVRYIQLFVSGNEKIKQEIKSTKMDENFNTKDTIILKENKYSKWTSTLTFDSDNFFTSPDLCIKYYNDIYPSRFFSAKNNVLTISSGTSHQIKIGFKKPNRNDINAVLFLKPNQIHHPLLLDLPNYKSSIKDIDNIQLMISENFINFKLYLNK